MRGHDHWLTQDLDPGNWIPSHVLGIDVPPTEAAFRENCVVETI